MLGWLTRWRSVGARGERAAARHLRSRGYTIHARNLRTTLGEIDILATDPDGKTLVLVEVKSARGDEANGSPRPEEHVNPQKQRKLASLALALSRRRRFADRPMRFDVIGVNLPEGKPPTIRHHVGAFESLY